MPFVAMANAVAGTIASSAEYNKVVANVNQLNTTRTKYKTGTATGVSHTVSTSAADVPGTSITVTTSETNTVLRIVGVFDVASSGAGDVFIGTCVVDGATQTAEAHFQGAGRATCVQQWNVTLVSAGAHTVKLQMAKSGTANTVTLFGVHSSVVAEGQGIT